MRFESRKTSLTILLLPFLLSFLSPVVSASVASEVSAQAEDDEEIEWDPLDIWDLKGEGKYIDCFEFENSEGEPELSCDYVFPWGGDPMMQFKEYYTFDTIRARMMRIAADNPDIIQFHEGLNGGINARGETTTADTYKGWEYRNPSPWLKITADVEGGDYNAFNGDTGNYADRPDVMIVGNHHAREWMSHTTPMLFLETVAYYYGGGPVDNDGDAPYWQSNGIDDNNDGVIDDPFEGYDEDPWGDADGDGQVDDDGDCLALEPRYQDSNGDGKPCNPGDIGVDEDFSEADLTSMVNNREIYLIPLLNTDGFIYDQTIFCPAPAWESCPSGGWRKNLRNNGPEILPDPNEQVDEDCDGVDLNRNYQFEWGWPLGATIPLVPGTCPSAEDERAGISNNDVYTGPFDTADNDGDGLVNEDNVDGEDDDNDGKLDEDWAGGNSEPETKFIQDMTEMNDDDMNGASDYKVTLTYHSYSELVLYPWGHCTGCQTVDHDQLVYHGDQMAKMTDYTNMQSSDLYPTTGDFCDWHYGVHGSYCYTMEIGTAFHQHEDDIDHIAVRNNGIAFYIAKIADNPKERADLEIANIPKNQYVQEPQSIEIPSSGDIPVEMCLNTAFDINLETMDSHVMYRMEKLTRQKTDFGPRELSEGTWEMVPFEIMEDSTCELLNNSGIGYKVVANIPIGDDESGTLYYKAMVSTLGGTQKIDYPETSKIYQIKIDYRAPYGTVFGSVMLFVTVAVFVWGGLGVCLRMMMEDDQMKDSILDAEFVEEAST